MYETEDITDNMNQSGYDGQWDSVVTPSMNLYRVTYQDGHYEVFDQDMQKVDGKEADSIINGAYYDPQGE